MMTRIASITACLLVALSAYAKPSLTVEPVSQIGVNGGREIAPGRDGNGHAVFCFDFVEGAQVLSSQSVTEAGGVVLDFEPGRSWPEADLVMPPTGNLLSSATRDPFVVSSVDPLHTVRVADHTLTFTPATLDTRSETRTLDAMVTDLKPGQAGVRLIADRGAGEQGPAAATLSGTQALICSPASVDKQDVGVRITFDPPVRAAGLGAFNRATPHGGDNNIELAAFDTEGRLIGRYRLPGGRTTDAGGKGVPMYAAIRAPEGRAIRHLYAKHLHASSRNLVFDDLSFPLPPDPSLPSPTHHGAPA